MSVVPETRIVDEIPDSMKKLGSFIARGFYGIEHAIVIDYIKRNVCIKEETLRQFTKFDPKQLRQVLIVLKNDKIIKERQIVETRDDGRQTRNNYYFINYRALLNVTKYKLDHMRQKLESKEKDDTHRASYKCTGCQQRYDVIEFDKLWDPFTQEMTCWRCQSPVEEDQTVGPSTTTRSLLAKFNEQMAPLFLLLQQLDGVQLAPHLLEPSLSLAKAAEDQVSMGGGVPGLGGRQSDLSRPQFELYRQGQGLTVNIEGQGEAGPVAEQPREQPVWLASSTVTTTNEEMIATNVVTDVLGASPQHVPRARSPEKIETKDEVKNLLAHEHEERKEEKEESEESDFEDVEPEVMVNGVKHLLTQVQANPDLIEQMTEQEKEHYVKVCQQAMQDMYGD